MLARITWWKHIHKYIFLGYNTQATIEQEQYNNQDTACNSRQDHFKRSMAWFMIISFSLLEKNSEYFGAFFFLLKTIHHIFCFCCQRK